jgi:hypothetical protein
MVYLVAFRPGWAIISCCIISSFLCNTRSAGTRVATGRIDNLPTRLAYPITARQAARRQYTFPIRHRLASPEITIPALGRGGDWRPSWVTGEAYAPRARL